MFVLQQKNASVVLPFSCREIVMTKYNLLFIDADEHIGMSKQIECFNDEQAAHIVSLLREGLL